MTRDNEKYIRACREWIARHTAVLDQREKRLSLLLHGIRGFRLWIHIRDTHGLDRLFDHRQEEKLFEAVVEHNSGLRTTDPTIAVCWDADRLDLHRKGIWPDARFMSTQEGIALCMTRIHPGRRTS
jgi:hypothetical protein